MLFEVCRDSEGTTEVAAEAEVAEAAEVNVAEDEIVPESKTEVGPIEQVAGIFAVVDEIGRVESAADETGVESEVDVALEVEVEVKTVEADADCWCERAGLECGG